ncbi:UNVERIFIED_CONTAM: hypothetical protein FKN15_008138 [Acipenser sinensis]
MKSIWLLCVSAALAAFSSAEDQCPKKEPELQTQGYQSTHRVHKVSLRSTNSIHFPGTGIRLPLHSTVIQSWFH